MVRASNFTRWLSYTVKNCVASSRSIDEEFLYIEDSVVDVDDSFTMDQKIDIPDYCPVTMPDSLEDEQARCVIMGYDLLSEPLYDNSVRIPVVEDSKNQTKILHKSAYSVLEDYVTPTQTSLTRSLPSMTPPANEDKVPGIVLGSRLKHHLERQKQTQKAWQPPPKQQKQPKKSTHSGNPTVSVANKKNRRIQNSKKQS
jgi:hypothetical protein